MVLLAGYINIVPKIIYVLRLRIFYAKIIMKKIFIFLVLNLCIILNCLVCSKSACKPLDFCGDIVKAKQQKTSNEQ